MKIIITVLLFFAALCITEEAKAQSPQTVNLFMHDGDSMYVEFILRNYRGEYIFPDDGKDFIRGRLKGEKTKINKSEIKAIKLIDQSIYHVFTDNSRDEPNYIIATYATKGKIDLLCNYPYGHRSVYGGAGSAQTTINKVATLNYVTLEGDQIKYFDSKERFKELIECPEFNSYAQEKKMKKKIKDIAASVIYYNEHCQ